MRNGVVHDYICFIAVYLGGDGCIGSGLIDFCTMLGKNKFDIFKGGSLCQGF